MGNANWVAVYIDGAPINEVLQERYRTDQEINGDRRRIAQLKAEVDQDRSFINRLREDLKIVQDENHKLSQEIAQLKSQPQPTQLEEEGIDVTMVIDGIAIEIVGADNVTLQQ